MTIPENTDLPAVIGTFIPIVAMLVGFPVAVISIVGAYWRNGKATECRAVLSQSMIDKGFSVDEIERVLKANGLEIAPGASQNLAKST